MTGYLEVKEVNNYAVLPVYNDHPWDSAIVAFLYRCQFHQC